MKTSLQRYNFLEMTAKAYNVNYAALDLGNVPFNSVIGELLPGESSQIHQHIEAEVFIFISGNGIIRADEDEINVGSGIAVRVSPFTHHTITNISTSESLRFISIYWNPELKNITSKGSEERPTSTIIFSPLPTPNGDLHIGHLSGPYLAADIYRRYLKSRGVEVVHITGSDDHQTYVSVKAASSDVFPKALADFYTNKIKKTMHQCGIEYDYFIKPSTDGSYAESVQTAFMKLYSEKYIIEKNELAAFSTYDGKYLHEAFIRGKCPHCLNEADGNACEECGRPNHCVDLIDAYEKNTGKPPVFRMCKRLYFRLNHFKHELETYINTTPMSARALALGNAMIAEGLPDICVSHPSDCGIPVPLEDFTEQKIYVWFELAIAHLWGAKQVNLVENEARSQIHFYGFDNAFYLTLLFPAIYYSLGAKQTNAHVINELLDLEGAKFSTTRNHVIGIQDLASDIPIDYIRWFLSEIRPEGVRNNFTVQQLIHSTNQTFYITLNDWMNKISELLILNFDHLVPEAGFWSNEHIQFLNKILRCRQDILDHYCIDNFSTYTIVDSLKRLMAISRRFLNSQTSVLALASYENYARTTMALLLFSLKLFALLANPIIPTIGSRLLKFLGVSSSIDDLTFIPSGYSCDVASLPVMTEGRSKVVACV